MMITVKEKNRKINVEDINQKRPRLIQGLSEIWVNTHTQRPEFNEPGKSGIQVRL